MTIRQGRPHARSRLSTTGGGQPARRAPGRYVRLHARGRRAFLFASFSSHRSPESARRHHAAPGSDRGPDQARMRPIPRGPADRERCSSPLAESTIRRDLQPDGCGTAEAGSSLTAAKHQGRHLPGERNAAWPATWSRSEDRRLIEYFVQEGHYPSADRRRNECCRRVADPRIARVRVASPPCVV